MSFRTLSALLLCAAATHVHALDRAGAVQLVVDLNRLDSHTTMMMYDEGDKAARAAVHEKLAALRAPLDAALAPMAGEDGEIAREASNSLVRVLDGGDGSPGMVNSGYDAQAFAEYRTALGHVTHALTTSQRLDQGGSLQEQALLLASRIVSVYIRTAGSPFGSYSDTNEAGTDDDLARMAARFDGLLDALHKQYDADPAKAAALKQVTTKWRFIRGTVVKYTQQSTPSIVYRHGFDILDKLATI